MFRGSTSAGAAFAAAVYVPGTGGEFIYRTTAGGAVAKSAAIAAQGRACFLFCGGIIFGAGMILRRFGRLNNPTILRTQRDPGAEPGETSLALSMGLESET
jgi:hypothetical protein